MSNGLEPARHELQFFLDLECAVWDALVQGDATADARLLSDDFLGVYPSGFSSRDGHGDQLNDGPTVASYTLSEPRLISVSASAGLLSYRADFLRPNNPATITWYVSSLWCERDGAWVNTFSQDTPAVDQA